MLQSGADLLVHAVVHKNDRPGGARGFQQRSQIPGHALERVIPIDEREAERPPGRRETPPAVPAAAARSAQCADARGRGDRAAQLGVSEVDRVDLMRTGCDPGQAAALGRADLERQPRAELEPALPPGQRALRTTSDCAPRVLAEGASGRAPPGGCPVSAHTGRCARRSAAARAPPWRGSIGLRGAPNLGYAARADGLRPLRSCLGTWGCRWCQRVDYARREPVGARSRPCWSS